MEHSDAIGVTPKPPRRVGLIGLGAIGETVAKALLRNSATTGVPPAPGASPDGVDGAALCAVLVRDVSRHDEASWLDGILITSDADAFFAARPEVVVEAAGQPAVAAYAEQALRTGADFIAASTGALTDDSLRRRIVATARTAGCGRMHLASGAMPGLDWMQAAAMGGGPSRVAVVQSKPPGAWAGTPGAAAAAAVGDWVAHGPLTIFEGNARRAASEFPKTSNVTATLALATVGLDATQVRLVAEPQKHNSTSLEFESAAGKISIETQQIPSATNPKTSAVVALSILRSLRCTCSPIYVGT